MLVDADRLAKQVALAYEFMSTLHGQAIALIRDVEMQLKQSREDLRCLRPGGYRFTVNPLSYGMVRAEVPIPDYYAMYFRQFPDHHANTPLDDRVPPILFLKIVFREPGLNHPEVRFGVATTVARPPERMEPWPRKFEDIISHVTFKALVGPAWYNREIVSVRYEDGYIGLTVDGKGERLADLPDSEAIAKRIVEPLLAMYRQAASGH